MLTTLLCPVYTCIWAGAIPEGVYVPVGGKQDMRQGCSRQTRQTRQIYPIYRVFRIDISSLTGRVHNATPRHRQRVRDQYSFHKTVSDRALCNIVQVTASPGRVPYMISANSFVQPRVLYCLKRRYLF